MTEDLDPIAYLLAAVLTIMYFMFFPGPQIAFDPSGQRTDFAIYRGP